MTKRRFSRCAFARSEGSREKREMTPCSSQKKAQSETIWPSRYRYSGHQPCSAGMDKTASHENLLRRFDSEIVAKLAVVFELVDDEVPYFSWLQGSNQMTA